MARDSSPIAQRLKALAQRAGLPVDDRPAAPVLPQPAAVTPADDEQPTGEVPRIDDPGEQPTGEIPAVAIAESAESDAPAAPSWMDPPAEEQTPPTQAAAPSEPTPDEVPLEAPEVGPGPTLRPPVIPPKLAPAEPVDATSFPEPTPVPDEPVFEAAAEAPLPTTPPADPQPTSEPEPAPEPSVPTQLDEALALPADEPGPSDAAPTGSPETTDDHDEQPTAVSPALTPDPPTEPVPAAVGSPDEKRTRLSFTGRLPSLRRRRAADEGPAPVQRLPLPESEAPAQPAPATAPGPAPAPEPVAATIVPEPPVALPVKPSFAERAALRRRARTLRARRDAGLLELGAIVLDQRRFGDPTAGALQRRRTDELADLDNEIAAIEQVIDQDSPATAVAQIGTVRCTNCEALVGPSDRFCAQCGTPRPDASAAGPRASS